MKDIKQIGVSSVPPAEGKTKITHTTSKVTFAVETDAPLEDMQRTCSKFFSARFGQRETFEAYRGFLIVRYTVTLDRNKKQRRTVLYLYGHPVSDNNPRAGLFRVGEAQGVEHAKGMVDTVLKDGQYT